MKIVGSNVIPFPVEMVWDALLDPRVLVATIPGCERLEAVSANAYDMTVTAGVASIKGTYKGSCELSDLQQHESLMMRLQGAGAPGTVDAMVQVFFGEAEPGVARVDYEAEAVVGGMVGGVGQRMLTSVSKRMASEFFDNVADAIASNGDRAGSEEPGAGVEPGDGRQPMPTFYRDAGPGLAPRGNEFVTGIAVGAGLVLLGVVAGAVFGRRR